MLLLGLKRFSLSMHKLSRRIHEFSGTKEIILNRVSLSGSDLDSIAQCLSQLFGDFCTDVVDRINCTPVSNKP